MPTARIVNRAVYNSNIDILWPLQTVFSLLQFPAFFLYFPISISSSDSTTLLTTEAALALLLCLCSLYKATGFLGPLFLVVLQFKGFFVYYNSISVVILLTILYYIVIHFTHPFPEACLDRLVLFLLACLGSRLSCTIICDHCAILALTTMTVSLTESLDNFREWFGTFLEINMLRDGFYHRRLLAKIRVLMIAILLAVLLKTNIVIQPLSNYSNYEKSNSKLNVYQVKDNHEQILSNLSLNNKGYGLTAREYIALIITLLIAIHLVAREIGLIKLNTNQQQRRRSTSGQFQNRLVDNTYTSQVANINDLVDYDSIQDAVQGKISIRTLESKLSTSSAKVKLRTNYLRLKLPDMYQCHKLFDPDLNEEVKLFYESVEGKCCENVVGFVPIPMGYVGPLRINNIEYIVPMASTEGALLASTSRGCKLLSLSKNGVRAHVLCDQMTRGPVFGTDSLNTSLILREFIESSNGYTKIRTAFENTSRFIQLCSLQVSIGPSTHVFVRFAATTGDAMGMNMVSKATEQASYLILTEMTKMLSKDSDQFVRLIALSGNYCTDKKSSSSNWLNGRGKSVVAEAIIDDNLIRKHLKIDNTDELIKLNLSKNFVGSAVSASQPGASCNAQAANVVAAIFTACGQDLGQIGTSSACMTWIERYNDDSLSISVTMPCVEVGTIGGGTSLSVQSSCLKQLGIQGSSANECVGKNSKTLACIVAATVMAAEISLLAALCNNTLVRAHMDLNRSK